MNDRTNGFAIRFRLFCAVVAFVFGMVGGCIILYILDSPITVSRVLLSGGAFSILGFIFPRTLAWLIELVTAGP